MTAGSQITLDNEADLRNDNLLVWANGAPLQKDEAKVSDYDNGSMLGDGTWAALRFFDDVWASFGEQIYPSSSRKTCNHL